MMIELTILGRPQPYKAYKSGKYGTYNPVSEKKQIISAHILTQFDRCPYEGALSATFKFHFKRPKSHYYTGKRGHILRPDAPKYPIGDIHAKRRTLPDVSNLVKFYEDCMEGIVFINDVQIVEHGENEKVWADRDYTEILIYEMP